MEVTKCKMLLYADDMVIFYSDSDAKILEDVLNKELNCVIHWLHMKSVLWLDRLELKTQQFMSIYDLKWTIHYLLSSNLIKYRRKELQG